MKPMHILVLADTVFDLASFFDVGVTASRTGHADGKFRDAEALKCGIAVASWSEQGCGISPRRR